MMKVVFLDRMTVTSGDIDLSELDRRYDMTYYERTAGDDLIIERLRDADAVITNKTPISKSVFDACPKLKFVTITATGYNIVDIVEAKKHGVVVSNVPAYSTMAVCQHIFSLLFEITARVQRYSDEVHSGEWQRSPDFTFRKAPLIELMGKTMGFIGMGQIGCAAGKVARDLGMKTVCYHSSQNPENCPHLELDELLGVSDIVALCCPLTADNKGMINKETIGKMKDGAILINTARGGLVNEADLAEALKSGKLYAAGIDVMASEPPVESPLFGLDNCIITPHIAWAPYETRVRLFEKTLENLESFEKGHPINVVS